MNENTDIYVRGLMGRCPACGKGSLFKGFLNLRPNCDRCGLPYSFANSDDGAAVFVILIAGFVVVGAALIVEFKYEPPIWVHALLWGPLILVVTLGLLRLLKGLTAALQYRHGSSEGGINKEGSVFERSNDFCVLLSVPPSENWKAKTILQHGQPPGAAQRLRPNLISSLASLYRSP